ncbi:MAG: N-methyl-L-tryptophan oxidase [Gemmataceae bacterium]|nr:N-methyl-L-tryptophan oxidase [Gemmataceae bacterium]MDW8266320.1 N-methyl-L-tryptophan oxidase [Gemmataceae bacterium]
MLSKTYDMIVLGLGAMGGATAFELARRGHSVLGLEQYALGHDRGSSHGQTRIIRRAYFEGPEYVPLLHRAYERWYELEQRTGRHLFTVCGCLSIGPPDGTLLAGIRRAAAAHHLDVEPLSPAELRQRYPPFQFADTFHAVYEPHAGFLLAEECVRAHLDEACRLGADLRADEPVVSWEPVGLGVVVRTARGSYAASRLIITAGSWTGALLRDLSLPLTVRRKVVFWFSPPDPRPFLRHRFPVYLCETSQGFYYGFPALDPGGVKVARHDGGDLVPDPSALSRVVQPEEARDCLEFLERHLPAAVGPRSRASVCLYTMTPDAHFVLDQHPECPAVVLGAGFSGHGFKFASVVGEILADLAEIGHSRQAIGMFRLTRRWGRTEETG